MTNPPRCIIGQITYDGGTVDSPCLPWPAGGSIQIAGVISVTSSNGFLDRTQVPSGIANAPCVHSNVAPAGLGGSVFNPNTGHFLTTNPNSKFDPHFGTVEEINPDTAVWSACAAAAHAGTPPPTCGIIVNSLTLEGCSPDGAVMGPGSQALIGCMNHDGMAFPPSMFIIDGNTVTVLTRINETGGVDEIWYNPGDNRYYLAARDFANGPKLGVIDAGSMQWLENVPTNSNSHSVSVEPANNHVWVPMQAGGPCKTESSAGCIGVFARE